jgi:methylmalonyl-CoA mutase N-terminal domain/subunit
MQRRVEDVRDLTQRAFSNASKHETQQKVFETDSGIPVAETYLPQIPDELYKSKLGKPGEYPFTRGIYPTMYRERLWTMRQYTGFGSAKDTNIRFKYLLREGQTGLSVAFDLPTQLGLDSDSPLAEGEVGKVGVAISSLENMATLFSEIPIDRVSTSMTINSTASTMLAMYLTVAESRGIKRSVLRGTTQNDILKEYAARNTYIYPPEDSFHLCVDIIEFCAKEMPKWHPISISGYHIREAGASAVQELAFTFANAIEYVNALVSRGLSIDSFCRQLSFFFACRNDFFEEIAKFRAARRIWSRIVKERFGSTDEESMKLKYHVQTSGETLTAQQPENNVVRVAIQALAAVLGGAQSIHTNSKDEALGLPTEEAVRTALRTQQIIAEETGVTRTVDPMGGSYYLEYLTDELEARAQEELEKIERIGGALDAIKSGYVQREIQKNAYSYQKQVDAGLKIVVGVNKYRGEGEREQGTITRLGSGNARIKIHSISQKSVALQIKGLKRFKETRDNTLVLNALSKLEIEASRNRESRRNLMYPIIDAVRAKATTGEISTALRKAFGEYRPIIEI